MENEKEQKDLLNFDKVFLHFHDFGKFDIQSKIPNDINFIDDNNACIIPPHIIISNILIKYGYATVTGEYIAELNEKGREAKQAGGHFAYLKQIAEIGQKEKERQNQKDKIDEFELFMKRWTYKSRYLPYIISGLALIVSIFSYLKPENKKSQIQATTQSRSQNDSLFQVDRNLKTSHK